MHGSNVWDRYALTAEKYNTLIEKANTEGISTTNMPPFAENDETSSKAYFALYQQVADAREKKGDTSMRPKVIWGMPYEIFADAVKKMPAASALKDGNLADLEKLIAQYEAMDDASRKAVASDVLAKYQALVAKGLALKAGDNRAANLYKDILALPDAANINDSNKEQVKASVDAIRKAMSDADKELLKWAGASVLGKLEAVEKELEDPTEKITVTFTLLGDHVHTETETDVHTLKNNNLETWIKTANYDIKPVRLSGSSCRVFCMKTRSPIRLRAAVIRSMWIQSPWRCYHRWADKRHKFRLAVHRQWCPSQCRHCGNDAER